MRSHPKSSGNPTFRIKLLLILLAGINMSVFHFTIYRNVSKWDHAPSQHLWAKLVGTLSVVWWAGVVVRGTVDRFRIGG